MKPGANNPIILGVLALVIVGAIFFLQGNKNIASGTPVEQVKVDKTGLQVAPDLQGIAGYINAEPGLSLKDLRGKVVLIDFWTYTCINCIRTQPYLNDWHEKYADDGLVIIGVHSPEFEVEKNYGNVVNAVKEGGIKYHVVLDNDFVTWRAYRNYYWPRKYLIDAEGYIRYDHIGEGAYAETEGKIVELLEERDANLKVDEEMTGQIDGTDFGGIGTPEIYLGSGFARAPLGNPEGFSVGKITDYVLPEITAPNLAYFGGSWETFNDYSKLASDSGKVGLFYKAKNVNIVAGSSEGSMLRVLVDGSPLTIENAGSDAELVNGGYVVNVKEEKLYNIVGGVDYSAHEIIFEVTGRDFEFYTFTFG